MMIRIGLWVLLKILFEAPVGCPDAATFEAELRARLSREPGPLVGLAVTVVQGDQQFEGALRIEHDGVTTTRRLADPDCRTLVSALVLVAILAVEREDELGPASTPVAPPPELTSVRPRTLPAPRPPRGWSWATGTHVSAFWGMTSDVVLSAPPFIELRRGDVPSFRAGFLYALADVRTMTATGTLNLWAARVDGCLVAIRLIGGVVSSCARLEAGTLLAKGRSGGNPQSAERPWLATGLLGRVRWHAGRFFFEVELGAAAPVTRDRFTYWPDTTLTQPASVLGWVGAGAGIVVVGD